MRLKEVKSVSVLFEKDIVGMFRERIQTLYKNLNFQLSLLQYST